jgi:hypothetical protein
MVSTALGKTIRKAASLFRLAATGDCSEFGCTRNCGCISSPGLCNHHTSTAGPVRQLLRHCKPWQACTQAACLTCRASTSLTCSNRSKGLYPAVKTAAQYMHTSACGAWACRKVLGMQA